MSATVVVIGGGYGGVATAKALDDVADVVLVEPKDAFVHNVAALRGLVDPAWTDRLFLPYDRLLARGRVVRDRAVLVEAGAVVLGSGQRIAADYIVLATGSAYPFPAKYDVDGSADAKVRIGEARGALIEADRVLLLGAGPVGLELAGEITAAWPDKAVTVVDPADDIVGGEYPEALREDLRAQLADMGVDLVLGTSLWEDPPSDPGETKTFTAALRSGGEVTADIWFRCFGVVPNSDYLAGELAGARRADGHLEVTAELRLAGHERVFAVGDVTGVPESKKAAAAGRHAEVVAANIRTLIEGGGELTGYEPVELGVAIPLGPARGASYLPAMGVLDAAETSRLKGADMLSGRYAEFFGLE
ncbi:MAG: FAD-dependent oxidoreductase [Streptosporangiales bacterium]|nr:FAD-dependent oxidoreductase [Streptosporangiales bacterium]